MKSKFIILGGTLALCVPGVHAEVKLPAIFWDNMVLQQGAVAPIWGKADPGEKVTVSVAGQSASAIADAAGKWKLKLQPLKAGGAPLTVTVKGRNLITLSLYNHAGLPASPFRTDDWK